PEDVLSRAHAERGPFRRFGDVEQDLPAIENRDRKQVEHRDVHAQHRDEPEELLEPAPRRGHRGPRDGDRSTELVEWDLAGDQPAYDVDDTPSDTPGLLDRHRQ